MKSIDLHVDYPWQCFKASTAWDLRGSSILQVDFPRMVKGGLDSFVAALYLSDGQQTTLGPDKSWNAIKNQIKTCEEYTGKVLLALEGGRLLNNSETRITELAAHGIRYITLTHNLNTDWADSATDKLTHNGLTARGKSLVRYIQDQRILVDVSHASDATTLDVISQTSVPIVATHSGCRSLVDHPRNLSDALIKLIAETGGLIGIPYATRFVRDVDGVVLAVDHIAQLTGSVDHIGIGSDLDGAATVIPDVSTWSQILAPLLDLGYTDDDLAKIKGGNFWRLINDRES
jgi:membrane dipeptidase